VLEDAIRSGVPGGANLEFGEPGVIRERSLNIFDRTFAVTYALEAVAVVIGLFGLSSSFGALVLARSREFGMLRHIGMTRRQIGGMLAVEGALVSSLGLATGMGLGWLISMVLIHVVNRQSFHWSMELHLPWGTLGAFAAAMLGLAVLTALASGRRADRPRARRDRRGHPVAPATHRRPAVRERARRAGPAMPGRPGGVPMALVRRPRRRRRLGQRTGDRRAARVDRMVARRHHDLGRACRQAAAGGTGGGRCLRPVARCRCSGLTRRGTHGKAISPSIAHLPSLPTAATTRRSRKARG